MKRLFVAAEISDEARSHAKRMIEDLRSASGGKGIGWSKPENLHVTIKFLGDTDEATETSLTETLSSIASQYQPFHLAFDKLELLGKRVISVAVRSDSRTIFSLEMAVDTQCEHMGFDREGRRFHPHLTLARIRRPGSLNPITREIAKTQVGPLEFEVRDIVLYESQLLPGGSVYKVIKRFPLSG